MVDSVYPGQIDGPTQIKTLVDGVDEIIAEDHNSLKSAVLAIEKALGVNPAGAEGTVARRLDLADGAKTEVDAHITNTTDAHMASAIGVLDAADNFVNKNVEGALSELAATLPPKLNVVGDSHLTLNSGAPNFVGHVGSLFAWNSMGGNALTKTQPSNITGIRIIEIGAANGTGTGASLKYNYPAQTLQWQAPGDSLGPAVDVSALAVGGVATLHSSTASKSIRVSKTSASTPESDATDDFELIQLNAATGAFSVQGVGIVSSNFITRTATSSTGITRDQFVIGGTFYPADKGTLVLQRKLRSAIGFTAIAVLDLSANFIEATRATGQSVYNPTYDDTYDTITLFDRLPAQNNYDTLAPDANGNPVYSNYTVSTTYSPFQLAKYSIPVSNPNDPAGTLNSATSIVNTPTDDVYSSAYRIVHYHEGQTDFNGNPTSGQIYSIVDALAGADDGDNTVRMSNVFVDSDDARPTIATATITPVSSTESPVKQISGVHYYNSSSDLFGVVINTSTNLFANSYLKDGILSFTSSGLTFPSGQFLGVTDLTNGTAYYSNTNLPDFTTPPNDYGAYSASGGNRPYAASNSFSTNACYVVSANDPFGAGASYTSTNANRILVNGYGTPSTAAKEYFVDEQYREGTVETFSAALGPYTSWTHSTIPLVAGELQVGGLFGHDAGSPGLVFPQGNWHDSVLPTQNVNVNYTGFSGDSIYQRLFSLGYVTNGGCLNLKSSGSRLIATTDFLDSSASKSMKIEVKIPGLTGWLNLGKQYKVGGHLDGNGCLTYITGNAGNYMLYFTTGQLTTADSGYNFAVRVTYLASPTTNRDFILSYLELLPPA
jgi:hypothetical protein